jgi:very-short-patch-repair endonuclease
MAFIHPKISSTNVLASKPASVVVLARRHRSIPTRAEARLWQCLRRRQIDGFQFRRQFPIGPYFADFFCVHAPRPSAT